MASKQVKAGQSVLFRLGFGGSDELLPFLVTHVYDDDVVSSVAFSGEPGPLGWNNRGAMHNAQVQHGNENRQWRYANCRLKDPELEPVPADDGPSESGEG